MKTNDVISTGCIFQQESLSKKEKSTPNESKKSDKLKILNQKKELANSQELAHKQRAQILHRLSTGFYNQDKILNKVADEILNSEEFKEEIKNES